MARWSVYAPDELDQKLRKHLLGEAAKGNLRSHGALNKFIVEAVEERLEKLGHKMRGGRNHPGR